MRVSAVLCAVMIGIGATSAAAQEPLSPGAFGVLGMYPKRLSCADVPVFSPPVPTHRLASAHEGDGKLRRSFSAPDTVMVPGGTTAGLQTGQQYFVRRMLLSPNHETPSSAVPGMVHTAGWITIIGADSFSALARIDHACDGFIKGDYLESFTATPLPSTVAAPGAPQFDDMGRLMFGNDGRRSFANGDLIVINRGSAHGLTAGARMSIYRDVKNRGPMVPVGHAIVLAVAGDTATVIADRVRDALAAGDWIGLDAVGTKP